MRIVFILILLALASCNKSENNIITYIPYSKNPKNYSLENAKNDNLIVFENGNITSGQDIWDNFIKKTEKGNKSMVRLVFYYTLDNENIDPEYYEEIKGNYPCLYIQDLNFDGKLYTLYSIEDEKEYIFKYAYLKRFEEISPIDTAIYSKATRFVLVNDNEVTWEQIFYGMVSSTFGKSIDHKTVYSKYIYK
jgi:hypothetical protein